jgi:hypothetical protein
MAKPVEKPYRVVIGLDYPENRRAEPGDVVTDLPEYAVKQLLNAGVIEEVEK